MLHNLRLNTLTVGYTLPKAWTTKAYMQKVRIYVTGGNLFCITGYSGLDPEVNSDPDKAKSYPTLGLDSGGIHACSYIYGGFEC